MHAPFPGTTRDHRWRRRLRRVARLSTAATSELVFRVTLIERRPEVGRGPAYHTGNSEHLLNVRAANMSALPDDPDHFWRWLSSRAESPPLSRPLLFRACGGLMATTCEPDEPFASSESGSPRLTIVRGECVAVDAKVGWRCHRELADGSRLSGLRHPGHGHDAARAFGLARRSLDLTIDSGLHKDATVLILGTGLTMADYVLTLLREGHRRTDRRDLPPRSDGQGASAYDASFVH